GVQEMEQRPKNSESQSIYVVNIEEPVIATSLVKNSSYPKRKRKISHVSVKGKALEEEVETQWHHGHI
ncbi:hypothetical protein chiPu_0016918, partial [Chiloscyllium punctatum]|nr:hypothetical protein [Chiloscyllium punctatum]